MHKSCKMFEDCIPEQIGFILLVLLYLTKSKRKSMIDIQNSTAAVFFVTPTSFSHPCMAARSL